MRGTRWGKSTFGLQAAAPKLPHTRPFWSGIARPGPERGHEWTCVRVELSPNKGQKWFAWEESCECVCPNIASFGERYLHVETGSKADAATGTGGQRGCPCSHGSAVGLRHDIAGFTLQLTPWQFGR